MEKILQAWAQAVQDVLGNELSGIVLYGSASRGEYVTNHSDLNLMVVFKNIDLSQLTRVSKITRKHLSKYAPQLICWTQTELKNAWDVFPLEFEDISKQHRVLLGEDPFKKSRASNKHIRYQLEFELRSKLLAMRAAWLELNQDRKALGQFLGKAGSSFEYLLNRADAVFKIKAKTCTELFEKIHQLKKGQIKLKPEELKTLFHQLHETVEAVIERINKA